MIREVPPTREELAAERRRLLAKARRHERRADRMPRIVRPLRAVTTALLRADLSQPPAHASDVDWKPADADDQDYHPRRHRS